MFPVMWIPMVCNADPDPHDRPHHVLKVGIILIVRRFLLVAEAEAAK